MFQGEATRISLLLHNWADASVFLRQSRILKQQIFVSENVEKPDFQNSDRSSKKSFFLFKDNLWIK